ncbi:MAG: IS4 family transposase, partial [Cytophagales bacterium]|nr:IS4 family transposase [Cytophagales bacterium]
MNKGRYVFSQLMDMVDANEFNRHVQAYQGNHRVRTFSCWHQFLCMSFGQLAKKESLRDTVLCLQSHAGKLHRLGISQGVSRSNLAEANEKRDCRIYRDLALHLIAKGRAVYKETDATELNLKNNIYAVDATTIDLCLSLFRWAPFRQNKAAVRLHTQIDLKCSIPTFVHISDGKEHEVNALDLSPVEAHAFYIFDKGYLDFSRLYNLHRKGAFFVIRAKSNTRFYRLYSHPKTEGIKFDQTIRFSNRKSSQQYPDKLRLVKYHDRQVGKTFLFLTNNFEVEARTVAALYKNRWKIELFFKWIKQHLQILAFWGQSENAVCTQVWIAVCNYMLVAILKKQLGTLHSMYEILQILSVSLFDKTPLNQLLMKS